MATQNFLVQSVVFVILAAAFGLGLGLAVRTVLPPVASAAMAEAPATPGDERADRPRIVAVNPAEGGGWMVQLDSAARLQIEPRLFETGGAAPTLGPVQAFADQTCLLGVCTGYAVLTDGDGTVYHGYRP